jgi:hypothetical protein
MTEHSATVSAALSQKKKEKKSSTHAKEKQHWVKKLRA